MTYQIPDIRLFHFLPFLVLGVSGLLTLILTAVPGRRVQRSLPRLTLVLLAVTALTFALTALSSVETSFGGMLRTDAVAIWFGLVLVLATALTVALAARHFRELGAQHFELYPLLLLCCLGMCLMAAAGHLIIIFIGLELMSVALYIMAAMAGRRALSSNEAALKYLLLGAFATGFTVYGMAMVYGSTGTLDLLGINTSLEASQFHAGYMRVGLALLTIGLGFKVALVPFHMWAPDVYDGSPTVVTTFMSVGPKIAGFAALWRVLVFAAEPLSTEWQPVLAVLAVVTMLVGNLAALTQTNIKRLLAFSSIAHAGYLALGVMSASQMGLQGLLYYSLLYTFLSVAAFTVVLVACGDSNDRLNIEELSGLGKRQPLAALCLAVALIAMAGIPPFSGFVGKFLLFASAVRAGQVLAAVVGILCSIISVYYYFRLIVLMYMQPAAEEKPAIQLSPWTRWVLWATLAGTIVLSWPFGTPLVTLAGLLAG